MDYGRGANGDLWGVLLCTQEGEDLPVSQQIRTLVYWSDIHTLILSIWSNFKIYSANIILKF